MLLEYFQMIDAIDAIDLDAGRIAARSRTPEGSPVFDGHFPGMPLVPGVLLIETMAQASGFLLLAKTDFAVMPFLMSVDSAKIRSFVEPSTDLFIEASLVHEGSGYAVTKAVIRRGESRVADCQIKLRTLPPDNADLAALVRRRAEEIGLTKAVERSQAVHADD
jgi:3-hydroxyacyl-[acyl-carrier-protein] dehydratase